MRDRELIRKEKDTIITWINCHECFWLKDLKNHLGHNGHDDKAPVFGILQVLLTTLKRKGIISCMESDGSMRRYFRTQKIIMEDVV